MTLSTNAERAYRFFLSKGLEPHHASAIVGNFMQESGRTLRTSVRGDGGRSIGIAQWNGERREALERFAARRRTSPTDLQTQLEFAWHELQTTERRAFERLTATGDVSAATEAFSRHYERPGDPRMENRVRFAHEVAGRPMPTSGSIPEPDGAGRPEGPEFGREEIIAELKRRNERAKERLQERAGRPESLALPALPDMPGSALGIQGNGRAFTQEP